MYSEEEPQRQMSIPPSLVALDNLKHPPVIVFTKEVKDFLERIKERNKDTSLHPVPYKIRDY